MIAFVYFGTRIKGSSNLQFGLQPNRIAFDNLSLKATFCLKGTVDEISRKIEVGKKLWITKHDKVVMRYYEAFFFRQLKGKESQVKCTFYKTGIKSIEEYERTLEYLTQFKV